MRRREVLVQLQRLLELFDRLVVVAGVVKSQSQFKVDDEGEWIQFLGPFSLCNRFIMAAHCFKISAIPLVSCRIARIQLDGTLVFLLGTRPVPIVCCQDAGQ